MVYDIMNDSQRKVYEENLECDFSFAIPNLARFRVNAFIQHRGAGAVFRTIPSKVLTLEQLKARHLQGHRATSPVVSCWSPGRRVRANPPRWPR